MSAPAGSPRTVQIHSPSAARETSMVARALFFLLYGSALVLGAEIRGAGGDTFAPIVLDQILRRGNHPQADVSAVIAGIELFAGGSMPSDDASILAFDLPA